MSVLCAFELILKKVVGFLQKVWRFVCLKHSPKGETILLQTDLTKSNAVIPRTIQWKDVTLPEEWILEGATQPQSPKRYPVSRGTNNLI